MNPYQHTYILVLSTTRSWSIWYWTRCMPELKAPGPYWPDSQQRAGHGMVGFVSVKWRETVWLVMVQGEICLYWINCFHSMWQAHQINKLAWAISIVALQSLINLLPCRRGWVKCFGWASKFLVCLPRNLYTIYRENGEFRSYLKTIYWAGRCNFDLSGPGFVK